MASTSNKNIFRHLFCESILGFQFWSLFCGFFPMIWFYPLNALDVTGFEAFLVVLFVPAILELRMLARAMQSPAGLGFLRLISLTSLASFQAPTTLSRLFCLAVGTGANLLVVVNTIWSKIPLQRCICFWSLLISFFAILVTRIWYTTIFPTWADNQTNKNILSLATIATFDRIFLMNYNEKDEETTQEKEKKWKKAKNSSSSNWLIISSAFASLLYVTIGVFGEVSVPCRWVVKGYPNPGPSPNPWGAAVLISLFVGLILGIYAVEFASSTKWLICGSIGFIVLYIFPTYFGFLGSLILAAFVMSIWPEIFNQMIHCQPGRTVAVSMLIFVLESLFSVWTIAYNFVPGGEFTREHTGYLLGFIIFTWFLNSYTKKGKKPMINQLSHIDLGKDKFPDWKISGIFFCLLILGLSGFLYRHQPSFYERKIHQGKEKQMSALIWTFHFGYDNEGWPSLERAAQVLNETGADFITLLESDASKFYLGNNDLASWLSEKLSMHVDFGPSTKDHTWGNLILSKYPIVHSEHHLLPSPHGELAPAISATVDFHGDLVNFVTSHMGNDRDSLDRKLQAQYLANLTALSPNPVVFLGYVTSSPGSRDYHHLTSKGRVKDIDDTDRDRWCEYIMYRGLIRLGYARISHGGLSDTELQIAKFKIPEKGSKWIDNEKIEIDLEKVPIEQRFNERFGVFRHGHNWIRNHQFHASTPKYFLPLKS